MSSTNRTLSSKPHTILTGTFACAWCGLTVSAVAGDRTRRNHCRSCLHSQHVLDHAEGGSSDCQGRMSPIAIAVLRTGDWMVIHQCLSCGEFSANRIAGDDNALALVRLALKPLWDPSVAHRMQLALRSGRHSRRRVRQPLSRYTLHPCATRQEKPCAP